uniref:Uncharacterized protein n=1 Tax=Timema poppense TaxID=170557 RepID=A0A7R9H7T4_TIMPO|nr:unnamed protein product [Timema poppensis]
MINLYGFCALELKNVGLSPNMSSFASEATAQNHACGPSQQKLQFVVRVARLRSGEESGFKTSPLKRKQHWSRNTMMDKDELEWLKMIAITGAVLYTVMWASEINHHSERSFRESIVGIKGACPGLLIVNSLEDVKGSF